MHKQNTVTLWSKKAFRVMLSPRTISVMNRVFALSSNTVHRRTSTPLESTRRASRQEVVRVFSSHLPRDSWAALSA